MALWVLIVEDSPATRSFIAQALEDIDDIQIVETGTGFEALKVLPRYNFDLILTDINMPDINGLELISFIRKNPNYQNIPLFIISTESSRQDREKGMQLGANEYIVKPFNPDMLQKLVKKYLKLEEKERV
jgi:two-component system chemotaxis response regulator CheY